MRFSKRTLALAISSLSILAVIAASFFATFGARAQASFPSDETLLSPYTYQVYLSGGNGEESNKYTFKALMAWQRELHGDLSQSFKEYVRQQLLLQAQRYPSQMPGASAPDGVPGWTTIGPTRENHLFNDVKLNETDSAPHCALAPSDKSRYLLRRGLGWRAVEDNKLYDFPAHLGPQDGRALQYCRRWRRLWP
jgi:hypothetical protein